VTNLESGHEAIGPVYVLSKLVVDFAHATSLVHDACVVQTNEERSRTALGVLRVLLAYGQAVAQELDCLRRGLAAQVTVGGMVFIEKEVATRIAALKFFFHWILLCADARSREGAGPPLHLHAATSVWVANSLLLLCLQETRHVPAPLA